MLEPGSTRHSPRVDEDLTAETATSLQRPPDSARLEATTPLPAVKDGSSPVGIVPINAIASRSLLAISLRPSAFPGDRARLLEVARDEDAEERVIAWLQALPDTDLFMNVQHVWEVLGGNVERRDAPLAVEPHLDAPVAHIGAEARSVGDPDQPQVSEITADQTVASPTLLARAGGLAVAGVAITVGMAIGAVRAVRRRL
jgi:hypothetical protein